ncbi:MAG: 23S rRNA (adenine(2503)-C(2))-methyltransferase RlmN [Kiritimatiellae bacterium]|nr:23S rRNA (adenine(2503)-C(2))-methyltransferase RlmN [Kiritimatiellia bacterium]
MHAGHTGEDRAFAHGLGRAELAKTLAELGEPAYRADQVWHWLYRSRVADWAAMRNIPAALRDRLARRLAIAFGEILQTQGEAGGTRKLLIRLRDAQSVETVAIPARGRRTVCVSTQVGCKFGCAFCASGQGGFVRDLAAGEIVGQVLAVAADWRAPPTHVVLMGMGEPLDNYDQSLQAVRILNDAEGLNIGARRITISTCGLIPGIQRLAGEGIQVELSVSLHAPDDTLRSRLMPVNRKYPLPDLLRTCEDYARKTGRIITFEYALISAVNDSRAHAESLAGLVRIVPSRVNLIPLSPVAEYPQQAAPQRVADMFMAVLARAGVNATLRVSKGARISAACGQLRRPGTPARPS